MTEDMKLVIVGTGYVGLVTGVSFAEMGYHVTCIDIDEQKIAQLKMGKSPIFEQGLEPLIKKNIALGRLHFTAQDWTSVHQAEAVFITVGTPLHRDGSLCLKNVETAAVKTAKHLQKNTIIVVKSTVPVGTNESLLKLIRTHAKQDLSIDIVSNPEFLREGSAIHDVFHGDRIVIGSESEQAFTRIANIYRPFQIPIVQTDIRSAELIKYASNAFLATKISFINEISAVCERVGANIDDVAYGMGLDARIGAQFLQAGIGYGGSCFPKDTKALVQLAGNASYPFPLLESVIHVNHNQQRKLVTKALERFGTLTGKRAAVLGLAFKPHTDDVREAASLVICEQLLQAGATVIAYDPAATEQAKKVMGERIDYTKNVETALRDADLAFIVTEWPEIKALPLSTFVKEMKGTPVIFDGRNCYDLTEVRAFPIEYYSIGRPDITLQP